MLKKISEHFKLKKQDKEEFISLLDDMVQKISVAQQEYISVFKNKDAYVDVRHINDWKNKFSRLHDDASSYLKDGMIEKKKLPGQYEGPLSKITSMYEHIEKERAIHNSRILDSRKSGAESAFAKVSKGTPAEYQINAILSEDRRIVITGAPSTGKTTALKAKIEYLKAQGFNKGSDIVVLHGGKISEFADLALKILDECGFSTEYERPAENILPDMIKKFLGEKSEDSSYRGRLIDYYFKFHSAGHTAFDFDSQQEYEKFITLFPPVSLAGDRLKSYEELDVANFLFSLGIKYEYNVPFNEDIKLNGSRTQYKPDFTLPDYGICINIYEKDGHGQAPFDNEKATHALDSYIEEVRAAHEEAEIPLIECYSYEKQSGDMLSRLQAALSRYNVKFNIRSDAELLERITTLEPDFINILAESIRYSVETILASGESEETILNLSRTKSKTAAPLYKRRERMMSLILPFCNYYMEHVKKDDFRIIWRCANILSDFSGRLNYQYIFIDDAENMNAASAHLVSDIVANCDCKIIIAGCGWCSAIGRNGADPVYLQDFGRFFPGFAEIICDKVYNLPQGIFNKMRSFALNDTGNIEFKPKNSSANYERTIEKISIHYDKNAFLEKNFLNLLSSLKENSSVLVACRYDSEVEFFTSLVSKAQVAAQVDCINVLCAQGKYDTVIWTNTKYTDFGFPDERICLNNISDLLLRRPDSFSHVGERNLLCKAISHTKDRFIILYDEANTSCFSEELI